MDAQWKQKRKGLAFYGRWKIVGIDESFYIGGEYLKFAGDGSAVNAINCGCASPSFPREDVDFVNTGEI